MQTSTHTYSQLPIELSKTANPHLYKILGLISFSQTQGWGMGVDGFSQLFDRILIEF